MATVATVWWVAVGVMSAILSVYHYAVPAPESTGDHLSFVMTLVPGILIFGIITFGLSKGRRWAWVVSAAILGLSGSYYLGLAFTALVRTFLVDDRSFQPFVGVVSLAVALPMILAGVTFSSGTASRWFAAPKPPAPRTGTAQWLVIATGVCMFVVIGYTALWQATEPQHFSPERTATTTDILTVYAAGVVLAIVAVVAMIQLVLRHPGGQFGVMAMCAAAFTYPYTSAALIGYSSSFDPGASIFATLGFVLAASLDLRQSAPDQHDVPLSDPRTVSHFNGSQPPPIRPATFTTPGERAGFR